MPKFMMIRHSLQPNFAITITARDAHQVGVFRHTLTTASPFSNLPHLPPQNPFPQPSPGFHTVRYPFLASRIDPANEEEK